MVEHGDGAVFHLHAASETELRGGKLVGKILQIRVIRDGILQIEKAIDAVGQTRGEVEMRAAVEAHMVALALNDGAVGGFKSERERVGVETVGFRTEIHVGSRALVLVATGRHDVVVFIVARG